MTLLEIKIEESAENSYDVLTMRPVTNPGSTDKERAYAEAIRHEVMKIASKKKASTKYVK